MNAFLGPAAAIREGILNVVITATYLLTLTHLANFNLERLLLHSRRQKAASQKFPDAKVMFDEG